MKVAVDTGETEVRIIVGAAVFERANVFDVQRGEGRIVLMGLAILASLVGTLPHEDSRGAVRPRCRL